jgi:hypothetical protein
MAAQSHHLALPIHFKRTFLSADKYVAGATYGLDQIVISVRGAPNLAAQPTHMSFDNVGARIKVQIPYILKQHRSRYWTPGVTHQKLQ